MLDLGLYDRIPLSPRPLAQRFIAERFLRFDYRDVEIVLEGLENLPRQPALLAMNHTDNFNYWPLQYVLHRDREQYTATWVKGKNYEHVLRRLFMQVTNNIPIASRGYVVTRDFVNVVGRRPTSDEYRALRDATDAMQPVRASAVPAAVLAPERDMLGRRFDRTESYVEAVDGLMNQLMQRFVDMNRRALDLGLSLLVFPQGTRSIRLSRGHIGIAQLALHLRVPIVPVGCNGCDLVYPGNSMRARPGRVVYRIGEPISEWGDLAPTEPFTPFTRAAEAAHRPRFVAVVDRVMDEINELLDERHRYSDGRRSDGSQGTDRFV